MDVAEETNDTVISILMRSDVDSIKIQTSIWLTVGISYRASLISSRWWIPLMGRLVNLFQKTIDWGQGAPD